MFLTEIAYSNNFSNGFINVSMGKFSFPDWLGIGIKITGKYLHISKQPGDDYEMYKPSLKKTCCMQV